MKKSEAPERIEAILDRCMKVQPKTLNEPHAHLKAMMRLAITEYIRTDINEIRVKMLENQLDEALNQLNSKKYSVSVLEELVAKIKEKLNE